MRIVAGTARGRMLLGPKGHRRIRPTADRVRETVFNILGQWFDGIEVLDLYAGTGALALEAISRGAGKAVLVDRDPEALKLCRANCLSLGFSGRATILSSDVERAVRQLGTQQAQFDLIFADPPYAAKVVQPMLGWIGEADLLKKDARCVIEHDKREESPSQLGEAGAPGPPHFLQRIDLRIFGDTCVSIYRRLQ